MLQVYGNIALLRYAYLGVFFYKRTMINLTTLIKNVRELRSLIILL